MRNLNWTYIIITLILTSGFVGYGLINYNQTKLITQQQQAKKVVKVITPTTQPTIAITPTITYKATVQTQPSLSAAIIGKELKAMYPAQYGSYSDEEIGKRYIAKYGNTPISQVQVKNKPLIIQTNCNSSMAGYTSCTSVSN